MAERKDFSVTVTDHEIIDLKERLAKARLPEKETVDDWSQGIPLQLISELTEYWRDEYDWRRCESKVNAHPQFLLNIDGLDIHFLHVRSPEPKAKPLLMTHGWPGSVIEFLDVIGPLTNPVAHGGSAEDAFHLVIPSLPGYGYSEKPDVAGWHVERIASAWDTLMVELGYSRYLAQGGDWGGMVTALIGEQNLGHCAGIHLNLVVVGPPETGIMESLSEEERRSLALFARYQKSGVGYAAIQGTRPQTLGYGLADSPVGQMAWIVEKFGEWSSADFVSIYGRDKLLDNVSWYWFTNTAASSARLYWHSFVKPSIAPVHVPTACSIFPHELIQPSRRWAEQRFKNIHYWNQRERGGHFAAMEQPEIFVEEVRSGLRSFSL